MNSLFKGFRFSNYTILHRTLSATSASYTKNWRVSKGLSANRTAEGILTDGPDYTFQDGRPTPLLQKQKLRMLKQQDFATKIVTLNAELNFAQERHQNMLRDKQAEREAIISNRLKPKGKALLKKR